MYSKNDILVTVCGSRTVTDYQIVKPQFNFFIKDGLAKKGNIVIVSGRCHGPDSMGEYWAEENGYDISYHPAEWNKYGKSAGFIRNKQMVDISDYIIAIYDGKSKGTLHSIRYAIACKKPIAVVIVNTERQTIKSRYKTKGFDI